MAQAQLQKETVTDLEVLLCDEQIPDVDTTSNEQEEHHINEMEMPQDQLQSIETIVSLLDKAASDENFCKHFISLAKGKDLIENLLQECAQEKICSLEQKLFIERVNFYSRYDKKACKVIKKQIQKQVKRLSREN